ncbi:alpha/beta-hydrolase [Caulochytrium protostelioides]|uniref:Alpha/beta-hydrolase n=1 Tax=Caulochytrium protostelioides TaxID=1555241 RepID=A0A4P9WXB5_9FUNG|nr:alpha/beta-hydrolase [Caulochytrium protostelioides]
MPNIELPDTTWPDCYVWYDQQYSHRHPAQHCHILCDPRDYSDNAIEQGHSVLFWIHGGAWRSESARDYVAWARRMVALGYVVVIVEYRLTLRQGNLTEDEQAGGPDVRHPDHQNDVEAAWKWACQHLADFPCNVSKRWIIGGQSVGASMALCLARDQLNAPSLVSITVSGLICVNGCYDFPALAQEYPSYRQWITDALGDERDGDAWKKMSPQKIDFAHQRAAWPPVLVLTSRHDELLSPAGAHAFVTLLTQCGILVESHESMPGTHLSIVDTEIFFERIRDWSVKHQLI